MRKQRQRERSSEAVLLKTGKKTQTTESWKAYKNQFPPRSQRDSYTNQLLFLLSTLKEEGIALAHRLQRYSPSWRDGMGEFMTSGTTHTLLTGK